jgi:hypothetical protein
MRHPWYGGKAIFYGTGVKAQRLVSYAASFGNHDASEGLHPWWAEKLRAFSAIAVRDENSRAMIRNALGVEPEMVLDPCLQFPPEAGAPVESERPYLAVYGHSFPGWFAEAVRGFADRRGWPVVSIGYRNDWADEQRIDACPEEFAQLIAGSAAVATNFFHGCVFSLVKERPFVCATTPYRSNKVRDLLTGLGADEHLTAEGDGEERFERVLGRPLDPAIQERIGALRQRSEAYLAHVLA